MQIFLYFYLIQVHEFCSALSSYPILLHFQLHICIHRLAGQIGWIVSIAPDVVKSTIQTSEAPMGILETTKQIVASRGIRGLFAGVEVRNRIDTQYWCTM